jgi:DNA invertase Pin-like site-specific DNA recombinase
LTRKPVQVSLARKTAARKAFPDHEGRAGVAMLIGYARVSKADGSQALDLQRDALAAAGIVAERIYEDRMSGRHDARPGLEGCLKALREGDTLVVWKLDRLGRNLRHLVELIEALNARGVGLRVLTGQGAALDTTRPEGRLVFGIFAALAEFERALIAERTRAGLAAARARGRKGGRPRKMTAAKIRMAMAAMADRAAKPGEIARGLGVTTTTLYDYVNGDGSPKAAAQRILATG